MGIDYGKKRVGIALSDEVGMLAYPKVILHNDKNLVENIRDMCKDEEVGMIVLGESKDMNGKDNDIMTEVHEFAEECRLLIGLPVVFENESFTSFEAHTKIGKESLNSKKTKIIKNKELDSRAAALILQRFLDKESD